MKKLKEQLMMLAILLSASLIMTIPQNLNAQPTYKLVQGKDVTIKVLGSSNVHDWTEISTIIESQGDFILTDDGQLTALNNFSVVLNAKSLKSEHESMDSRTYKAMNADKYPKITFKLGSAAITTVQKGKFTIKANGDLTISGVTQNVTLDVTAVVNADNSITCTGNKKIKLTDYKIDPPSFMLGAMKVANDLTIQFNLTYKK